jgi:uncharacterized protein
MGFDCKRASDCELSSMAKGKPRITRVLLTGALIVTGLYVVCCIGLTLGQRKLMYHPCGRSTKELHSAADNAGFRAWVKTSGEQIGWVRTTRKASRRILLLHGNAGCAPDWFQHADAFQAIAPVDFYILEYPGYGGRKGKPNQAAILEAAKEGFEAIPGDCPVFLVGESLGTGVAAFIASGHPKKTAGIFLVAPYNSMSAVARSHLPLFPVKWMLKDTYPSTTWLASYNGPLAALLGGKDTTVPRELGQDLYDRYLGPKTLFIEANSSHEDLHKPNSAIIRQVLRFWDGQGR